MACDPLADPFGCITDGIGEIVSKASNDGLREVANQIVEAFGRAVGSLGTAWVYAPTPVLSAGGGTTDVPSSAPGQSQFTEILGYVQYIGLTIAILSLIGFAVRFMVARNRGQGMAAVGGLGFVLLAVLLISGAASLVAAILPTAAPGGSGTTVGFLQNSLWFYVGGLAVLSVIVGAIRMAWEQRAQPGKDVLQSLITLVVVAGAGLLVVGLAVTAADQFSVWVINGSLDCDVSEGGSNSCFGRNIGLLISLTMTSPLGLIGVIVLGSIALLLTYMQIALMVIRGALLVLLTGVLPLTASFTSMPMGKQWFQKTVGWLIAFILYKPAAALVYAAAFSLTSTDAFQADAGGIWSILTGLTLMAIALIALPALLKLLAPMTGVLQGGGGAGMAAAGALGVAGGEIATGAIQRGRGSSIGAGATAAPSGANATGAASGAGSAARGISAGGGAAGSAAGGAAGGAAAGGSAAAAAGGPVGIGVAAVGAVAQGAAKAGSAVKGAAVSATEDATGSASQ